MVKRIWTPIEFSAEWNGLNTSTLDDIVQSWYTRREVLIDNSSEYTEFMNRLKRRHAIETGVIERMYDVNKGVTETLIKEGFAGALISHGDTNIDKDQLLNHLRDHLDAVEFIFGVVKDDRPFSKGFILELHQLTTRHQDFAEGRDQFGNKTKIKLLKGKFKVRENNPTREDGVKVFYCPPDHVESEMDRLIIIYNKLEADKIHPLIIATWFHHAFTTIHPFQDGNGRVIRLLSSLILIKHRLFPITVTREEAKSKYIAALELADQGKYQALTTYFAEIQRKNIELALNLKEVSGSSLSEVTSIFTQKIEAKAQSEEQSQEKIIKNKHKAIFDICNEYLNTYRQQLVKDTKSIEIYINSGKPEDDRKQGYYYSQIVAYATTHNYFFNSRLPKSFFIFGIDLKDGRIYEVGITIHHYGYNANTLAIGAFLDYKGSASEEFPFTTNPLSIDPYVLSITDDVKPKRSNIEFHLEQILTIAMAQIASEI